jgi:hypothetical protein
VIRFAQEEVLGGGGGVTYVSSWRSRKKPLPTLPVTGGGRVRRCRIRRHKTEYRDYRITAEREGQNWRLTINPRRPDLPTLRTRSFRLCASSLDEAVSNAQVRIDLLLDLVR